MASYAERHRNDRNYHAMGKYERMPTVALISLAEERGVSHATHLTRDRKKLQALAKIHKTGGSGTSDAIRMRLIENWNDLLPDILWEEDRTAARKCVEIAKKHIEEISEQMRPYAEQRAIWQNACTEATRRLEILYREGIEARLRWSPYDSYDGHCPH